MVLVVLFLPASIVVTSGGNAENESVPISEAGDLLRNVLDSTRVERLWIAGTHVDWKTGQPDGRPALGAGPLSHCSAFVAAVAYRLGIYILRPPEHAELHLANAQVDWLRTKGTEYGWEWVGLAKRAQELANQGFLVVAAYMTHDLKKSGHVAIVRPAEETDAVLQEEGPEIIQAGVRNYRSTTLKEGFKQHRGAFERREIAFFAHEVPLDRVKAHSWKMQR
jgi:hypothetical protein